MGFFIGIGYVFLAMHFLSSTVPNRPLPPRAEGEQVRQPVKLECEVRIESTANESSITTENFLIKHLIVSQSASPSSPSAKVKNP